MGFQSGFQFGFQGVGQTPAQEVTPVDLTFDELLALKTWLVPQLVTLLIESRSRGLDARADLKSMFEDQTQGRRVALLTRLGMVGTSVSPGDFNACVDTAMLQL